MEPNACMFPTKKDVSRFVQSKALEAKKPFKVLRSDTKRFVVCCVDKKCPFLLRFCTRKDGMFHLIRDVPHRCTKFKLTVTSAFVQDFIKEKLEENPALKTTDLCESIYDVTKVTVPWKKVHCSRRRVVEDTNVCESSFRKLSDLMRRLVDSNPGSVTDILISDGIYKALFVCPGACINAFANCHRIIFVDGCHVKAQCGGVLLFASSIDGNGQLVPIAMAHVPIENNEHWRWFLQQLSRTLSLDRHDVVAMSDSEKGLSGVVENVLPTCFHAFCVRYIKNFMSICKVDLSKTIWSAATTHIKKPSKQLFDVIKTDSPN